MPVLHNFHQASSSNPDLLTSAGENSGNAENLGRMNGSHDILNGTSHEQEGKVKNGKESPCQISRSVPTQLDSCPEVDRNHPGAGTLVKKYLRTNNLKMVLKAPWKSLKSIRLDKLARWKNQYDLSEFPNNRRKENVCITLTSANKPSFQRLGFGRLRHWRNHYDLREAVEGFENSFQSAAATYKFLEIRSMPDNRVVDSSTECLDLDVPDADAFIQDSPGGTTPTTSSRAHSETEV